MEDRKGGQLPQWWDWYEALKRDIHDSMWFFTFQKWKSYEEQTKYIIDRSGDFKVKAFQMGAERCYSDEKWREERKDRNTSSHLQSTCCRRVANFLISLHFTLSLLYSPLCQPASAHSIMLCRARGGDVRALHRGARTWVTAGRTSCTSLTYTHSLVKAMKGGAGSRSAGLDDTRLN